MNAVTLIVQRFVGAAHQRQWTVAVAIQVQVQHLL